MLRRNNWNIVQDFGIIVLSILLAFLLVQTHVLGDILDSTKPLHLVSAFAAGLFFTSIFTTAPAIAALVELMQSGSIFETALLAAAGAVIGDLVIFTFFRNRFSKDILELIETHRAAERFRRIVGSKLFRRLNVVVGALIIASPLPDELGIGLMGFAKLSRLAFIAISYSLNFIGIVLIGLVARSL